MFVFTRYFLTSHDVLRRQEPCYPVWDTTLYLTLYSARLSEMLFDGGNSNYRSNENCHTEVVGVLRAVDKVMHVSIYSKHLLLTLLIELVEVFSVLTSVSDSHCFIFFFLESVHSTQTNSGRNTCRTNDWREIT